MAEKSTTVIIRRVATSIVMIATLTFSVVAVAATPAQAGIVGQCNGAFWGLMTQNICVQADMGGKNTSNHTQWVGSVSAVQPDGVQSFVEVWGDGFYRSGRGVNRDWNINRWVHSGSGICAAATDSHGIRVISCISIKVK